MATAVDTAFESALELQNCIPETPMFSSVMPFLTLFDQAVHTEHSVLVFVQASALKWILFVDQGLSFSYSVSLMLSYVKEWKNET